MLNQKGGSRTDTLIKLVLIFFISLLSFSVGTFVGKQFSDSQHKMASLESEYDSHGDRETASIPEHSTEVKPDQALTEKDIQEIAEEFTKSDSKNDSQVHQAEHASATEENRHVANVETKPVGTTANAPSTKDIAAKAAERIAQDKAPTEKKPEPVNNMPKDLPTGVAASSIGKYTIQVSSHQAEDEAKTKATELKTKGFSAFVVPATVKGKVWYRVSVGLFDNMPEAKAFREKLLKEAGVAAAFVQQIVQ